MKLIEDIKQYFIYLRKRKEIANLTAHVLINSSLAYDVYYYNNKHDYFVVGKNCPKWLTYYLRYCNYVCETVCVNEDNKIVKVQKEYFRV